MMGYWPRTIDGIRGINIDGDGVPEDSKIAGILRRI